MSGRGLRRFRLIGIATVVVSVALVGCVSGGSAPQLGAIDSALDAGPERDSTDYVPPQGGEAAEVAAAARDLVEGRDPTLPDGYTVTAQKDVDVLAEEAVDGRTRGWGLYAVRRDSPSTVVIEVPHPRADLLTEDIGAELFASSKARALLVAGAHRSASDGSADVAHEPDSVFAHVDRAIVDEGWTVLQLHGFAEASHDVGAEAVVSSSEATPGPVVEAVAQALTRNGISACVYDGLSCQGLGGTRNTQGGHAREVGASFVHVELADTVRKDPARRADVVAALTEVVGQAQ